MVTEERRPRLAEIAVLATRTGSDPVEPAVLAERKDAARYWRTVRLLREVLGIDPADPRYDRDGGNGPGSPSIVLDGLWFTERGGVLIATSMDYDHSGAEEERMIRSWADLGKLCRDFPPDAWGCFDDGRGGEFVLTGYERCVAYQDALDGIESHRFTHRIGSDSCVTRADCPECRGAESLDQQPAGEV